MATIYRHWFPCTATPENPHGKGYTGYTCRTLKERDKKRFSDKKDSVGLKRAITKYTKEKMQTDIIESDILPIHELVTEREKYWIAYFDDYHNGYNRTKGGDGIDPEVSRATQRKLVENGTHLFLDSEFQNKMSELKRENALKQVENGTHNLLGGEIARKSNRKLVENGTHNLLRKNSHNARPEYYQVYWEFILLYPLGEKEVRKYLREKFGYIPRCTRNEWIRQWQAELAT